MPLEAKIPALTAIIPASEKEARALVVDVFKRPVEAVRNGITSNILPGRVERSAEQEKQQVVDELQKLELEEDLHEKLLPRLKASGCRIESDGLDHPYGKRHYNFTALRYDAVQAALLQVPALVFKKDQKKNELYIEDFTYMLTVFRKKNFRVRMFSNNIAALIGVFRFAFEDAGENADWRFIAWEDVESSRDEVLAFWSVFSLPDPSVMVNEGQPRKILPDQIRVVEDILSRYAQSLANTTPVSQTFGNLVTDSGWPEAWITEKSTGWANVAPAAAHDFVNYMLVKGTFPADHKLAGRSVLGEFLRQFRIHLGGEDVDKLASIVVEYRLIPDAYTFKKDYQHR
jgi:hypothetical protein